MDLVKATSSQKCSYCRRNFVNFVSAVFLVPSTASVSMALVEPVWYSFGTIHEILKREMKVSATNMQTNLDEFSIKIIHDTIRNVFRITCEATSRYDLFHS